jgi:hypothetical protein
MSKVLSTTVAIIGLQSAPRSPLTTTSAVLGLIPRCKQTLSPDTRRRASCGRGTCQATASWASPAEMPSSQCANSERVNDL